MVRQSTAEELLVMEPCSEHPVQCFGLIRRSLMALRTKGFMVWCRGLGRNGVICVVDFRCQRRKLHMLHVAQMLVLIVISLLLPHLYVFYCNYP